MHPISQELATMFFNGKLDGWTEAEIAAKKQEAYEEFNESEVGQKLWARAGNSFIPRFVEIFEERYGTKTPDVFPFYEAMLEVGNDLLLELPEPKPQPSESKANLAVKPTPKPRTPSKECAFFAHAYNAAVMRGIDTVRPRMGSVRLEYQGRTYEYPAARAKELLEEALTFEGLIH